MIISLALVIQFAGEQTQSHEFIYLALEPVKRVSLAGSFNNWNKDADPLKLDSDGKTWRISKSFAPGKYQYKFVLDGEKWVTDPLAKSNENDGNGNINSVLILMPSDYQTKASPTDGSVASSALLHETTPPSLNFDRGRISLKFRTRPNDLSQLSVVLPDGKELPMESVGGDELYEFWQVSAPWNRQRDFRYAFQFRDGNQLFSFGPNGVSQGNVKDWFVLNPSTFAPYEVPKWVEQTIFYQVFPDRFENGDPSNDPKDVVPWNTAPKWFNRFGGDIAGVQKRFSHLVNLGINGVYFNPIFLSPSNHRYDATDYKKIDPEFGTNEEFRELTKTLKEHGIRTVLDGVFNHTSIEFPAFADLRKNGQASKFKDWYFIKSYPVKAENPPNYEAWWGYAAMPKLNLANKETFDYMMSVVDFWNENAAISGWRLDVANEVSMDFWRAFRKKVKGLNSDAWIVGEVWGDGTPWLRGDQWDSVMNYQFRDAAVRFIAEDKITATEFANRLFRVYHSYAPQVSRNMMNLISSHDTPRFITLAGGDERLAKIGAFLQMTWVGAPSIYYGEELGMTGGPDPENRKGMDWSLANDKNSILTYYKSVIRMRRANPVLQSGDPLLLKADDAQKVIVFARELKDDLAIVAINRSLQDQTVVLNRHAKLRTWPSQYVNALSNEKLSVSGDQLTLKIPALSGVVYVAHRAVNMNTNSNHRTKISTYSATENLLPKRSS